MSEFNHRGYGDHEFDVSCCGYCGDVIDYCQGHGEAERAAYGFDYDSDEYERRRDDAEARMREVSRALAGAVRVIDVTP